MTKIIVADNVGFCPGVRRAVELSRTVRAERGRDIYTYGEIIHNSDVVNELSAEGIHAIDELDSRVSGDTVIIRSHGAPPAIYELCEHLGLNIVDATCAFVKRIHKLVSEHAEKGYNVIVVGAANHPEVIGILGHCAGKGFVVADIADLDALPEIDRALIVSQTTFELLTFKKIEAALKERIHETISYQTLCDTTLNRQQEADRLSRICDAMVVIGGANSSNTRKLLKICKKNCENSICIENTGELPLDKLKDYDIIGIVAGASTPDRTIREVITRMNEHVTTAKNEEEITAAVTQTAAGIAANDTEPESVGSPAAEETAKAATVDDDFIDEIDESSDKMPVSAADIGDQSFEEAFEKTMVRIRGGQILSGRVVQITDDEVCVNVGYKSDGIIPRSEFSSDPDVKPSEMFSIGDKIKVEVLKVNDGEGNVLLSRKNVENREKMNAMLKDADIKEKIFDAVGKSAIKGGLLADVNGMEAFIPASQIAPRFVANVKDYIGKPLKIKILEVDKRRKHLVASARAATVEIETQRKREIRASIKVGTKMNGIVKSITDFGAFVDIGGVEGLLHITDISWARNVKPADMFKVGQEVEVLVLNVDLTKERISLGYKQLQPKPWSIAGEKYPVGTIVTGKVVRLMPFGAFVSVEPTIDGLVHISEASERRIDKIEDALHMGDEVRCKVVGIDVQAKRMSLSRKAVILEENPELAEQLEQERKEREREAAERQAKQRAVEQARAERAAAKSEQQVRSNNNDRPQREQRQPRPQNAERPERERRSRREDADYKLPPIEQATTSLAGLLSGLALFKDAEEQEKEAPVTENNEVVDANESADAAPETNVE